MWLDTHDIPVLLTLLECMWRGPQYVPDVHHHSTPNLPLGDGKEYLLPFPVKHRRKKVNQLELTANTTPRPALICKHVLINVSLLTDEHGEVLKHNPIHHGKQRR